MARLAALGVLLPLLLLLPLLPSACAPKPGPAVTAAELADAQLAARVKTALLNDAVAGLRRIDVRAAGGQVTLAGRVASTAERDRAVALARAVAGVVRVTSELDIRP